jgi:hypothetical protein
MNKTWVLAGFAMVLALGATVEADDLTVIALPDTQNYSELYPELFNAQTQWIADNLVSENIRFVTHLGDVVQNAANIPEWVVARAAMDRLDNANVPYGIAAGNHDIRYPGDYYDPDAVNYRDYFGPQYYQGVPWYGGASPTGHSNYQIINVGGDEYLFLHLMVETPAAELAWAQTVINEHAQLPVWLSTHRYLFNWIVYQGRYSDFEYTFEPLYRHDGIKANDLFNGFIARNRQIFILTCGHSAGEYRQVTNNNFGQPVHEVLADYQDGYGNGGNGYLRIMRIRRDQNRIDVQSYSPSLNEFLTDDKSQFSLNVDFSQYVGANPSLHFQNGSGGYNSTVDTWINEDEPNTSYGSSGTLTVDDDTANSFFNDYEGQTIVAWQDLTQGYVYEGDPAPTRLPAGANILNATATFLLRDDVDWQNPKFYIYRMTRSWSESSTWNSLSNGIRVGDDADPTLLDYFYGDNDPDNDYWRTVNVTPAVQAWVTGSPNHGICVLPERIDWGDDGIDMHSSESGDAVGRPSLNVEFTYDVLNRAPNITAPLAVTVNPVYEGEEIELTCSASDPNPTDPLVLSINGVEVAYATGSGDFVHLILAEDDGDYDYAAEVADDETSVNAGSVMVTALNVAPTIIALTEDLNVEVNESFDFLAEATDPGIWDVLSYAWDLDDDGQYDDHVGPGGTWAFDLAGTYPVRVEVSDGDGGFTYGEFSVEVVSPFAYGDYDGDADIDLEDYYYLADCLSGPDAYPNPTPPVTPQDCLDAFDFEGDGVDVDLNDAQLFFSMFTD